MYQYFDEHGNTCADPGLFPIIRYSVGVIECGAAGLLSGIGECSGALRGLDFNVDKNETLSLEWVDTSGLRHAIDLGTILLQREPFWLQNGGWNVPRLLTPVVAFGAQLPSEDIFIPEDSTWGSFPVKIYLKTNMAEDSMAEQQVAVGKFKLLYSPSNCSVAGATHKSGVFATWIVFEDLVGEFGIIFRNGRVAGHNHHLATIAVSCRAGTHFISVETTSYADSNGLSAEPQQIFASSVGRADAYLTHASVVVKQSVPHKHIFAYATDGRVVVNDLSLLGWPSPDVHINFDSISDNPNVGRSQNVGCLSAEACVFIPDPNITGEIVVRVQHSHSFDSLSIFVHRPKVLWLSATDTELSLISCHNGSKTPLYQTSRLILTVDGLEMTHLASFNSTNSAVVQVIGRTIVGISPGIATVHLPNHAAAINIMVSSSAVPATLTADIITGVVEGSPQQYLTSENSFGYLYAYASYANGDVHPVAAADIIVDILARDKILHTFEKGMRHRISVVRDASATSCGDNPLRVALSACKDWAEPSLNLDLPHPVYLKPLMISSAHIASPDAFARSDALEHRPEEKGVFLQATVVMSSGDEKSMLGDERVSLVSSDPTCVDVVDNLGLVSSHRYAYRALLGAVCTNVTVTVTFTVSGWTKTEEVNIYLVRSKSVSVIASLYPLCSGGTAQLKTLYTLGCATPAVRQRAKFTASYALTSDDTSYEVIGLIDFHHSDVYIRRVNLVNVHGLDVHEGLLEGPANLTLELKGMHTSYGLNVSDAALTLSNIHATAGDTLVSSLRIALSVTFSGYALDCHYEDEAVRSAKFGAAVVDLANFEVQSDFVDILSVASDGTLTALKSHFAMAGVLVRNKCKSDDAQILAIFVNRRAGPGHLDLGSAISAPLQAHAAGSLSVPLWFDLSSTYSDVCMSTPIETIAGRLLYNSSQLRAQHIHNTWEPHHGSFQGMLQLVAQPVDAPDAALGFDSWSQVLYADIVQNGFNGRNWELTKAATVKLDVLPSILTGRVAFQVEVVCDGNVHYLPSSTTALEMPFTTAWRTLASPPAGQQTAHAIRQLIGIEQRAGGNVAYGDVTGDGVTNALDITAMVQYYKAPEMLNFTSINAHQLLWLDANRDGKPANAGDILYATRAYAGATAYPVFQDLVCPSNSTEDFSVLVRCFSAAQTPLGSVPVTIELAYDGQQESWLASSGEEIAKSSSLAHTYFRLHDHHDVGHKQLKIRPSNGWQHGAVLKLAYIIGTSDNSERRAIFGQTSKAAQNFGAFQTCRVSFSAPSAPLPVHHHHLPMPPEAPRPPSSTSLPASPSCPTPPNNPPQASDPQLIPLPILPPPSAPAASLPVPPLLAAPPAQPGFMLMVILPVEFVIGADVASFNCTAFRLRLLALVPSVMDVVIVSALAGSVHAVVHMIITSVANIHAVNTQLRSWSMAILSIKLEVPVVAVHISSIQYEEIAVRPPPLSSNELPPSRTPSPAGNRPPLLYPSHPLPLMPPSPSSLPILPPSSTPVLPHALFLPLAPSLLQPQLLPPWLPPVTPLSIHPPPPPPHSPLLPPYLHSPSVISPGPAPPILATPSPVPPPLVISTPPQAPSWILNISLAPEGNFSIFPSDRTSSSAAMMIGFWSAASTFAVIGCALIVMLRRKMRLRAMTTATPAFSQNDVGKRISVRDGTLSVDGQARPVCWKSSQLIEANGRVRFSRTRCYHQDAMDVAVTSVQERIGGAVILEDGSALENPAAAPAVRYESLEGIIGTGPSAPVRLVHAHVFIDIWEAGGKVKSRNELSDEHFYNGSLSEPSLQIIAVSAAAYARSQTALKTVGELDTEGFHLQKLAALFRARIHLSPRSVVVVYFNQSCLDTRAPTTYRRGMEAVPHIFGHPLSEVWLLPSVPNGIEDSMSAHGWLAVHHAAACSLLKSRETHCLDFRFLKVDADSIQDWQGQVVRECRLPTSPPPSSSKLAQIVSLQPFVHPTERALATDAYETFLQSSLRHVRRLDCRELHWGDLEAYKLASLLPLCEKLCSLDLSGNSDLSDIGVAALAASLPATLCELNLRALRRRVALGCPIKHMQSRTSLTHFRRFYLGDLAVTDPDAPSPFVHGLMARLRASGARLAELATTPRRPSRHSLQTSSRSQVLATTRASPLRRCNITEPSPLVLAPGALRKATEIQLNMKAAPSLLPMRTVSMVTPGNGCVDTRENLASNSLARQQSNRQGGDLKPNATSSAPTAALRRSAQKTARFQSESGPTRFGRTTIGAARSRSLWLELSNGGADHSSSDQSPITSISSVSSLSSGHTSDARDGMRSVTRSRRAASSDHSTVAMIICAKERSGHRNPSGAVKLDCTGPHRVRLSHHRSQWPERGHASGSRSIDRSHLRPLWPDLVVPTGANDSLDSGQRTPQQVKNTSTLMWPEIVPLDSTHGIGTWPDSQLLESTHGAGTAAAGSTHPVLSSTHGATRSKASGARRNHNLSTRHRPVIPSERIINDSQALNSDSLQGSTEKPRANLIPLFNSASSHLPSPPHVAALQRSSSPSPATACTMPPTTCACTHVQRTERKHTSSGSSAAAQILTRPPITRRRGASPPPPTICRC